MPKNRGRKKKAKRPPRIPRSLVPTTAAQVNLDEPITPDRLLTAMTGAAEAHMRASRLPGEQWAFALSMSTLVAAKVLVTSPAYRKFQPEVAATLDVYSDEVAMRDIEVITGAYRPVGWQRYGERFTLHLVRDRALTDRWCPADVKLEGPSPFPTNWSKDLPSLIEQAAMAITGTLGAFREAAAARGTEEQQTHLLIAEAVAILAAAKLHLALWGNDQTAAALEYLAAQQAAQLWSQLPPELLTSEGQS